MPATRAPLWLIALLILSAEAIFALPFHVARFFRPTLLRVFEITHTELGVLQSAYGFVALLAYFPGGILADRFSPRVLVPAALLSTAAGGLYFATLPSYAGLFVLHLFWGATTILLFWGALIRATRETGTEATQGRAFGLLDGGRGLLAAMLATVGVLLLTPEGHEVLDQRSRAQALRNIILLYTAVTAGLGVLAYLMLSRHNWEAGESQSRSLSLWRRGITWLREPQLLFHAAIIVAAYCAYKGADFYSVYGQEAFGLSEVDAASLATVSVWVRPLAALAAGLAADRFTASRLTKWSFGLLTLIYLPSVIIPTSPSMVWWLLSMVLGTSVLVYAFRSLYFVLISERGVPESGTGTAVGVVSFLGFSPDFFFPTLSGWILDRGGVESGYQQFFAMLVGFALLGWFAAGRLMTTPPEALTDS